MTHHHERAQAVLAGLDETSSWREELYRDLHQHPELSHQGRRTAAAVRDRLNGAGFEIAAGVGGPASSPFSAMAMDPPCCCAPTWTHSPSAKPRDSPTPARPLLATTRGRPSP
jgi:hippurate hydrolase